jgi:hypothetical protein
MTVAAGHLGSVTYTPNGSDSQTLPFNEAPIFEYKMELAREMVEVTRLNLAYKEWLYSHGTLVVDFKARIDQAVSPGMFNYLEATLTLFPNSNDSGKKLTAVGYLEKIRWEVMIGAPNTLIARFRGTTDPTYAWS